MSTTPDRAVIDRAVIEALTEASTAIERRRLKRRERWLRRRRWPAEVESRWSQGMWDAEMVIYRIIKSKQVGDE